MSNNVLHVSGRAGVTDTENSEGGSSIKAHMGHWDQDGPKNQ